ncbi:KpsF/GutQ family sugar-phosphate isomerase [Roseospira marina]|uniref:KpsF/GutQ family sugar-phosphate isomerase n=1 Tax=Roseospira marina TaxID=140057 RepID=A0A5M6IGX1_9PROT|nr:KpsF/GutQ family sugar-phosphate isomerase [Roseospira marina]KAA5607551.1 KpsF/GutQ family sugar-phosphate isomerase [Roseospira marina]MBB4312261.1 arabinose-5-phosphate isomerase [Roseospira marina]MBB5085723.1 arabinose-5-phosphate isomerase [Roseospira marina]
MSSSATRSPLSPTVPTVEPAADDSPALRSARRVLQAERDALDTLASTLGPDFDAAVTRLLACRGRVTVTGMGKSGHVGRKIAATMASTGTLAQFVHPAEASHGDLGMIGREDLVLALSNSGNTPELSDLIAYTRRFGIPLVGITARADGALAQASDVALVLPPHGEACPLGLAPTTSTTLMMALGDALAVALLEARGFSARDFQVFHPGGRLGKALLRVGDVMHSGEALPLVTAETPMSRALIEMSRKGFGCVGIVASLDAAGTPGPLLGVVTDGDLRRHMAPDLVARPAGDIMTRDPRTVPPSMLAAEALHIMNAGERRITNLFVVENGRPVGFIHMHDLLRAGVD